MNQMNINQITQTPLSEVRIHLSTLKKNQLLSYYYQLTSTEYTRKNATKQRIIDDIISNIRASQRGKAFSQFA